MSKAPRGCWNSYTFFSLGPEALLVFIYLLDTFEVAPVLSCVFIYHVLWPKLFAFKYFCKSFYPFLLELFSPQTYIIVSELSETLVGVLIYSWILVFCSMTPSFVHSLTFSVSFFMYQLYFLSLIEPVENEWVIRWLKLTIETYKSGEGWYSGLNNGCEREGNTYVLFQCCYLTALWR